ncbi:type II toxin-antitoxin system RnlB family antitoxin [Malaciobacter pacificus]|uniref:Toxin-antitoxin system, antitoxin component, RnlB family n=1 Tax=Malaciobacter pacificus TaxID=1080223 RepID=A0A5C2HA03_9BACT|nr:type II toxin-antitoxin system RnlB family antitoxin [Malaciobacter pacificus]QEP35038.1 toxin-antitoxin system, antitoxin component, RnlB family [Malaciobacter pacificus]
MTINKIGNFIIVKDATAEPFLLATSYNSKLKTDKSLIQLLKDAKYEGKVFVDMLMKVGNGSQRFYSSFFNGSKFDMNNTQIIKSEDELLDTLLKIEKKIICTDKSILNNSILTEYDKMEFSC